VWRATSTKFQATYYVALFNTSPMQEKYVLTLSDVVGQQIQTCDVRDLGAGKNLGKFNKVVPVVIDVHGVVLYAISECAQN